MQGKQNIRLVKKKSTKVTTKQAAHRVEVLRCLVVVGGAHDVGVEAHLALGEIVAHDAVGMARGRVVQRDARRAAAGRVQRDPFLLRRVVRQDRRVGEHDRLLAVGGPRAREFREIKAVAAKQTYSDITSSQFLGK